MRYQASGISLCVEKLAEKTQFSVFERSEAVDICMVLPNHKNALLIVSAGMYADQVHADDLVTFQPYSSNACFLLQTITLTRRDAVGHQAPIVATRDEFSSFGLETAPVITLFCISVKSSWAISRVRMGL